MSRKEYFQRLYQALEKGAITEEFFDAAFMDAILLGNMLCSNDSEEAD